jgi:hypothetical protein
MSHPTFSKIAAEISVMIQSRTRIKTAAERDAEWHRVNSYIADILKDVHMTYAKLARLQSDFTGDELVQLEELSERILSLGSSMSKFSKAFYEGQFNMLPADTTFGGGGGGGGGAGMPGGGSPMPEGAPGGIDIFEEEETAPGSEEEVEVVEEDEGQGQEEEEEEEE